MTAPESRTSARMIVAGEREREACAMRKAGATYQQIADKTGLSRRGAYKCVTRSMERAIAHATEDIDVVRRLDLERLDAMLLGVWGAASRGDLKAVDVVLRIMKRRADLLGEDAPTKLEHAGPGGGPIAIQTIEIVKTYERPPDDDAGGDGSTA